MLANRSILSRLNQKCICDQIHNEFWKLIFINLKKNWGLVSNAIEITWNLNKHYYYYCNLMLVIRSNAISRVKAYKFLNSRKTVCIPPHKEVTISLYKRIFSMLLAVMFDISILVMGSD
jgi:hypothetical protein